jgi:hypothetical protein
MPVVGNRRLSAVAERLSAAWSIRCGDGNFMIGITLIKLRRLAAILSADAVGYSRLEACVVRKMCGGD